jgi:hypothetical protein
MNARFSSSLQIVAAFSYETMLRAFAFLLSLNRSV